MSLAIRQLSSETRALAAVNRWRESLRPCDRPSAKSLPRLVAEVRAVIDGQDLICVPDVPERKAVAA